MNDLDELVWAARFALRRNTATVAADPRSPAALAAYRHVARTAPGLTRAFDAAALVAARPTTWPGCRWCAADHVSRVHELTTAALTAANRALLGEPCRACLAARREALAGRVAAARSVVAPGPAGPATSRTARDAGRSEPTGRPALPAARPLAAAFNACAVCAATEWLGLTASAAPPHNRTPVLAPSVRTELRRRWHHERSHR